jgi:PadR family transcriptional regulator PadR
MGSNSREPRLTLHTLRVLNTIIGSPDDISGAEIAKLTNLASGTLYPILLRLEDAQWLHSHWECDEPQALGRPRRRLYGITDLGALQARAALRDMKASFGEAVWA